MQILIIDDEINICYTLKGILEDEGYSCEISHNGSDGLKMIHKIQPDIIMLDVKMEDMDGIQVLEEISKIDSTIQVIMISGHSVISDAVKAIKLGAFDFLEKPLSLPKVKITVKKAADFRTIQTNYYQLKQIYEEQYKIVGESNLISNLKKTISKVAPSNAKVLIRGESGTGKELIAFAIHSQSKRHSKPFIIFNSAAIPNDLVESELFGYEKGSFTGAHASKKGKLEEANNGTLFLDEIGDMSLSAQAKILRVIQEGEFERIGSNKTQKIDARIIAATHKNLEEMVEQKLFREDLYYRLNVVPIISPALRDRIDDIPLLINHFSKKFSSELKVPLKTFSEDFYREIKNWKLKGNVRELRNFIERIYILSDTDFITKDDLPSLSIRKTERDDQFWKITKPYSEKKKEFEKKYLVAQLQLYENNISKTAAALSLHQGNLSRKLKELDIKI